jgi:hypothetical protein
MSYPDTSRCGGSDALDRSSAVPGAPICPFRYTDTAYWQHAFAGGERPSGNHRSNNAGPGRNERKQRTLRDNPTHGMFAAGVCLPLLWAFPLLQSPRQYDNAKVRMTDR